MRPQGLRGRRADRRHGHAVQGAHVGGQQQVGRVRARHDDRVVGAQVGWIERQRLDPDRRRLHNLGAQQLEPGGQAAGLGAGAGDHHAATVQRPLLEPVQPVVERGDGADQGDRGRAHPGCGGGDSGERRDHGALSRAGAVRDHRGGGVGAHAVLDQAPGVVIEGADAHQEHERPGGRRERCPVEVALGLGRILVPGHERHLGGHAALRHGNARVGRDGVGRRHAGHDLERNPGGAECKRLLAAAAEDERIAALQPHHRLVAAAQLQQQGVDRLLGHRVLAGTLAGVVALAAVPGEGHDAIVDQAVVDQGVAGLDQRPSADGQKPGVAGPGTDQVHRHRPTHRRSRSSPSSCQAYAATGTVQPPPRLWTHARSASTAARVGPWSRAATSSSSPRRTCTAIAP